MVPLTTQPVLSGCTALGAALGFANALGGSAISATTATSAHELPRRSRTPSDEPRALRALEFVGAVPVLGFLFWSLAVDGEVLLDLLPTVLAWMGVVAIADLLPIPIWGSVQIAVSFPVLLAAAMVFPAHVACFLAFVGPLDVRELKREISVMRGLFNRSNIATSILCASLLFHALSGDLAKWPYVLGAAFLALVTDVALNGSLVAVGTHLLTGVPVRQVWRHMAGEDRWPRFLLSYLAFGLLAVLLGSAYQHAGNWSLVAFAVPLLLVRQMFLHWRRLEEASIELLRKQQALVTVTQRIADERRDERLAMAAGIHDEVLPPLYQVHLMGQVLRQDLASGRLLELETDLPDLLRATEAAKDALRGIVREIRESPLGSRGLGETLGMLIGSLRALTDASFEVEIEEVGGSPLTQLLVYQIAREALTNAARHAEATRVRLFLGVREGHIRLVVEDDGRGFEAARAVAPDHFGIQLMRERAEIAGGVLLVESRPDGGVIVAARIPLQFPSA